MIFFMEWRLAMATLELSKHALIQYLEDVLDLEESCLQQQSLYDSLGEIASRYSNDNDSAIQLPIDSNAYSGKPYLLISALLAVVSIVSIVWFHFSNNYMALIIFIGSLIGLFVFVKKGFKQNRIYKSYIKKYNDTKKAIEEQENRWESNFKMQHYYTTQQVCVMNKYVETRKLLDAFYEANIIYPAPRYRGIIPVSEFCDYLKSGACNNLPEAYNKYDLMSRLDKISTQLDQIIDNLEAIRNRQYSLYCILRSVQNTNERLLNAVQYYGLQLQNELSRQNEEIRELKGSVDRTNDLNIKIVESTELVNKNVELKRKEDEYRYRMKRLYGIG